MTDEQGTIIRFVLAVGSNEAGKPYIDSDLIPGGTYRHTEGLTGEGSQWLADEMWLIGSNAMLMRLVGPESL